MKAVGVKLGEVEVAALSTGNGKMIPEGVILPPGPVQLVHPVEGRAVFRNGWHSWSFAGYIRQENHWLATVLPERRPMVDHPRCFEGGRVLSSGVAAIGAPEEKSLLLGALSPGGWIEIEDGLLKGDYEGKPGPWFLAYGSTTEVFAAYLRLLASNMGINPVVKKAPRVWCSWYSFYHDIDEKRILEVIEGLKGLPIDVVQLDDGWQKNIGDWEANAKFPHGLKWLAQKIQEAGFIPGIWMAPFIVRENSQLARRYPDWILKDETGKPVVAGNNWGGIFYALDISRKDVLEWLKGLLGRLWAWGFRYLKLDFLYAGALPGQGENEASPEMAYRTALKALKEAWKDGYLLACGAPVIASLGACDGLRIGPDVAPYWSDRSGDPTAPGAQNAIATSASRLWLKPAVHTDPDVVFFRSRYSLLTEKEKRILWDLAWVSGVRGTSDPPGWLDEGEKEELIAFFSSSLPVRQESFYRFKVADRSVDFEAAVRR